MNLIEQLFEFTYAEGRRLAVLVKIGAMDRKQLEYFVITHPTDAEPKIAIELLDGGSYESVRKKWLGD